jgi:hypothetical protein
VVAAAIAFAAGVLIGMGGCATLGGTSALSNATPGEPFAYPTHCGVGQVNVGGTTYYPTGVFDGDEPVTGSDPSWYVSAGGPTPWITVADHLVVWEEGTSDMNSTYGTLERGDADGTAVFHVNGGRWSIRLSTDAAAAAWFIEGCA